MSTFAGVNSKDELSEEGEIYRWHCDEHECGKKFNRKTDLARHINQVHRLNKYACDQCDYKAGLKGNLVAHKLARHGNGVKHFQCHLCTKAYKWQHVLKRHMIKHSIIKIKIKCNLCEKQYAEKR